MFQVAVLELISTFYFIISFDCLFGLLERFTSLIKRLARAFELEVPDDLCHSSVLEVLKCCETRLGKRTTKKSINKDSKHKKRAQSLLTVVEWVSLLEILY